MYISPTRLVQGFHSVRANHPQYDLELDQNNSSPPQFKKIFISNVICRNASRAVFIKGLPEMAIQQVELKWLYISAKEGFIAIDTDRIKLDNITILSQSGPVLSLYNCRNMEIKDVLFQPQDTMPVFISGSKTMKIIFKDYQSDALKNRINVSGDLVNRIHFQN